MQYIDWMLFSDDNLLLCRKDEKSNYKYKKELIYETDSEYNKFDLINTIFTRKTSDLLMEINFKEKTCKFDFQDEGSCKFDIDCSWTFKKDILTIIYSIDETTKKLRVVFKELIL